MVFTNHIRNMWRVKAAVGFKVESNLTAPELCRCNARSELGNVPADKFFRQTALMHLINA